MGLEGFPDYWAYLPGASDSARYKALSNSVAIPCVDFVLRGIALTFTESTELSERSFNMEPMKNLCGLIPESLHKRLMENKDPEMTNGEYLTKVLTAYLDQPATPRQEQRTLAVQISEEMFQQLKSYLDAHSPLTQKAFVQSLLNQALGQWEQGEEPLQDAAIQDNKKERTLAITMPETLFQRVEPVSRGTQRYVQTGLCCGGGSSGTPLLGDGTKPERNAGARRSAKSGTRS